VAEKERMQEALNVSVVYDSPKSTVLKPHTLAGVEKKDLKTGTTTSGRTTMRGSNWLIIPRMSVTMSTPAMCQPSTPPRGISPLRLPYRPRSGISGVWSGNRMYESLLC